MTYTWAALEYYDLDMCKIYHHIFQPNGRESEWKTVEPKFEELIEFKQSQQSAVNPVHKKFVAGSHCEWCNKLACPEYNKEVVKTTDFDWQKDDKLPDFTKMPTEKLLRAKKMETLVKRMFSDINAQLLQRAMAGEKIPKKKLVHRLADRAWKSEKEAIEKFGDDIIEVKKTVMSPAQVEKILKENVDDMVEREQTGYSLVAESSSKEEVAPPKPSFNDNEVLEDI